MVHRIHLTVKLKFKKKKQKREFIYWRYKYLKNDNVTNKQLTKNKRQICLNTKNYAQSHKKRNGKLIMNNKRP